MSSCQARLQDYHTDRAFRARCSNKIIVVQRGRGEKRMEKGAVREFVDLVRAVMAFVCGWTSSISTRRDVFEAPLAGVFKSSANATRPTKTRVSRKHWSCRPASISSEIIEREGNDVTDLRELVGC